MLTKVITAVVRLCRLEMLIFVSATCHAAGLPRPAFGGVVTTSAVFDKIEMAQTKTMAASVQGVATGFPGLSHHRVAFEVGIYYRFGYRV